MPISGSKPSIFSKMKSIKMPVFQLIFYSSIGYLGYIFYQDYHYKQLVQQIKQHSGAQNVNPLKKISLILSKVSEAQGKRQLKFALKDLELGIERYWVDPHKSQNLIDFEMKQLQKSEQDKKIWWIKPYVTFAKLLTDHYHRSNVMKEGTFGLFFWTNYKVQQKNQVLQCKTIRALIEQGIKLRNQKCQNFAIDRQQEGFQDEDKEILDCLKQTSREVAALYKMQQRIKIIKQNQSSK